MSKEKYIQPSLDELFSKDKLEKIHESRYYLNPSAVDLGADREKLLTDRDTPIRDQVGPLCTAYGTIAAMENRLGGTIDLSEFDLWSNYRISNIDKAIAAAENNYICEEKYWPEGHRKPSAGYTANFRLRGHTYLERDFLKLASAIDNGHPCIVALATPNQLGKDVFEIDPNSGVSGGVGHALAVSGYKVMGGRGYFLVKNSWGPRKFAYQYVPIELYDHNSHLYFYEVNDVEVRGQQAVL